MLKIKFTNGKEVEYIESVETEEYFNGANRRTLTVKCEPESLSIDELNAILSKEENLTELVMTNINEKNEVLAENIYGGYVLKLELGVKQVEINSETNTYADQILFKLGKRTYIEEQLKKLGL